MIAAVKVNAPMGRKGPRAAENLLTRTIRLQTALQVMLVALLVFLVTLPGVRNQTVNLGESATHTAGHLPCPQVTLPHAAGVIR